MRKPTNKSDFVRSMKPGTPAKEVVALAKKRGLKLTERYVYVIRSSDKAKARRNGGISIGRGRRRSGAPEEALRTAIAELGLGRARQVMAEVERTFSA